jgi:methionyl-tRNA synthetase
VHCDHEYLNLKGAKLSKSRGAFVEVPYFLNKYDADALRFYLTATAPETRDTEFSWEDFVERNNNELVATHSLRSVHAWGNLANARGYTGWLSFAYKRFDGKVPEPGDPSSSSGQGFDDEDRALLAKVEAGFETVGELYNACKFRAAPSIASGQAWARRWPWPARPTATRSFHSVQAWTARHPGSRSRKTARRRRRACTSSCVSWTI